MTVRGVVLAAGRSRRMGRAKALLPAAGATFLRHAVEVLASGGCDAVTVVVPPPGEGEAVRIAAEARATGAAVIEAAEGGEQIHSLRAALRSVDDQVSAVVVLPVDFPALEGRVVSALIEGFRRTSAPVVVPMHGGKHGHPVLFARATFGELMGGALPEGARSVVHAHAAELLEVPVDAAGVLLDVDTPADFRRVVEEAR